MIVINKQMYYLEAALGTQLLSVVASDHAKCVDTDHSRLSHRHKVSRETVWHRRVTTPKTHSVTMV